MKLLGSALVFLTTALEVTLWVSDSTPFSISQVRAALPYISGIRLSEQYVTMQSLQQLDAPQAAVVLDYSYTRDISLRLMDIATDSLVICMYADCPLQEVRGRLRPTEVASNITAYLQELGFTELFLAASVTPFYQAVLHYLSSETLLALTKVISVKAKMTKEATESLIGHMLKPAGSTVAALLVDEDTGKYLYPALQYFRIAKKGYAYFFSDEAAWYTRPQGGLYVTDSVAVTARSRLEYETLILTDQLQILKRYNGMGVPSMKKAVGGTSRPLKVSLVNMKDGMPVLIGNSPSSMMSDILFPGNTSVVPIIRKPLIEVSADFTALNYDGTIFPTGYTLTRGISIAYSEINKRRDLMPNFEMVNNTVNLGGMLWNKTWALSQLSKTGDSFGIAFHAFGFSATIIGIHDMLAELGKFTSITSIAVSALLSNPVRFPMFLRTSSSGASAALVMLKFFQLWGWKRIGVVYSDGIADISFYNTLMSYTKDYPMEIVNNETSRKVPLTLTSDEAQSQLNATLRAIMSTTVRVVVIAYSNSPPIVQRMYEMGARAGDYSICLSYGLSSSQFNIPQTIEPLHGGMMFYDHYFTGAEGERIRNLFIERDGKKYEPVGCVFYDSALLVAHAVEFMLMRGLLYEDGESLVHIMRQTRFVGCMGTIQIEEGTNDKRPGDYSVLNAHVGPNSTLTLVDGAYFSPSKSTLFTILPNLTFPDGTAGPYPDTWPTDPDCPYLVKDIRDFAKGRTVGMLTSFLFTALTGVITLVIWRRWWRATPSRLVKRHLMSIEDGLALLNMPIEFLQFIQMGPKIDFIDLVRNALSSSSFSVEELLSFSKGMFWGVLVLVMGLVILYLILSVVKFTDLDSRLSVCSTVGYWGDLLLPSLGNLLFLPVISTLLSTFNCYRSVGDNYTDSFLNRDCYEKCWTGTHMRFSIGAAICLCLYTPVAVFTRPLWQELQPNLHIKALPLDLLVRSVVQMALISASITLKLNYEFAHALVYLAITSAYLAFVIKIKPFNYERLNMWRRLMIIGLVIYGLVGLIHNRIEAFNAVLCTLALFISYVVLGGIGLALQYFIRNYRALIVREKEDKQDIIKFAFTWGKLADTHLRNYKSNKMKSKYSGSEVSSFAESMAPSHRRVPVTTGSNKSIKK